MEVAEYLIRHHVRPNTKRMAVMQYLLTHHTHPTVDDIYTDLSQELSSLSRTTVYSTLKLLVDHQAATMLTIDEKRTCFDGDTTPHAHFLCNECGRVFDLPYVGRVDLPDEAVREGFVAESFHQYYRGTCKECNRK